MRRDVLPPSCSVNNEGHTRTVPFDPKAGDGAIIRRVENHKGRLVEVITKKANLALMVDRRTKAVYKAAAAGCADGEGLDIGIGLKTVTVTVEVNGLYIRINFATRLVAFWTVLTSRPSAPAI